MPFPLIPVISALLRALGLRSAVATPVAQGAAAVIEELAPQAIDAIETAIKDDAGQHPSQPLSKSDIAGIVKQREAATHAPTVARETTHRETPTRPPPPRPPRRK